MSPEELSPEEENFVAPETGVEQSNDSNLNSLMVKIAENKAVVKGLATAGALLSMLGGVKSAEAGGNAAVERLKLNDGVKQHIAVNLIKNFSPESVKKVVVGGVEQERIEGNLQFGDNLVNYWAESPSNRNSLNRDHQKEAVGHWKEFEAAMAKNPQIKAIRGEVGAVAKDFLGSTKEAPKISADASFENATIQDLIDRVKNTVLKVHDLLKGQDSTKTMMAVEKTLIEIATDETAVAAKEGGLDNDETASTEE